MIATKYIMLFENIYKLEFAQKDLSMIESILVDKPSVDEFEDFCLTWDIDYKITKMAEGENTNE